MEDSFTVSNIKCEIDASNTRNTNPFPPSPAQISPTTTQHRQPNSPQSPNNIRSNKSHTFETTSRPLKHVPIKYQPVILGKGHSSREHCFPPPLIGLGYRELHISRAPPHLRASSTSGNRPSNYNISDSRNISHRSPPPQPPSIESRLSTSNSPIPQQIEEINGEPSGRNHPSGSDDVEKNYDGQIHGMRHKKHGPYICSKCNKALPTSQHFASHVIHEHYKTETEDDRRKRREARVPRRRRLRLQQVNGEITLVPVSSQEHIGNNNP